MEPNPYTPGRVPRWFVGREQEVRSVRRELAPLTAYGEMLGPPLVLTGPRGVGKTSLLHEIRQLAEADGYVVARTAGVKQSPFLGDVVQRVASALDRAEIDLPRDRRLQLQELSATIGGSLASVGATLKLAETAERPHVSAALLTPVEEFLHNAATLVRERGGAGLLILIDELHEPLVSTIADRYQPDPRAMLDAAVLLNVLQNLDDDRDRNPLGVIAAGLPETADFLTRAATFAERTNEIRVSEFDPVTAREVLNKPARELGVTWQESALDLANQIAKGYPQALQVVGKWTWDIAGPDSGAAISLDNVQAALPDIKGQLNDMHRRRWNNATPSEREFLRAMARLTDPEQRNGAVRRADIAREMDRTSQSISDVRNSCISKGIIASPQHGYLRFTIPGLAEYIAQGDQPDASIQEDGEWEDQ